ncbi:MAG: hypothetical protein R2728_07985 [Chitinophagales bacterium]
MILEIENLNINESELEQLTSSIKIQLNSKSHIYWLDKKDFRITYKCIWWGFYVPPNNPLKYFASRGSLELKLEENKLIVVFKRRYLITLLFYFPFFLFAFIMFAFLSSGPLVWMLIPIGFVAIIFIVFFSLSYLGYKNFVSQIERMILEWNQGRKL